MDCGTFRLLFNFDLVELRHPGHRWGEMEVPSPAHAQFWFVAHQIKVLGDHISGRLQLRGA